jgi:gamma-glutamyl-gamma-aminobutyraldehyde dehydrogenase
MNRPDLRPFVGGRHHDSAGAATIASIDPSTEDELWRLPAGDPVDVDLAVAAARAAVASAWSRDDALRAEALLRLADLVEQHAPELAGLDTTEIGIPIGITSGDAGLAASIARDVVSMIADIGADAEPPGRRVPRGVVAILSPWNFPFFVAFTKAIPALAAGNAVVLKPTELATASAMRLGELAHEAGLPSGALSVVPGRGDVVGEALVRHPGVDQVNLTGSTGTGRRVLAATAATTLTPVLTELGGKSAHVVGEHVDDLATVADAVAQNIFWASGQVCSAGSRLIVHERHHDALVALLLERAAAWQPGDPTDPEVQAGPLGSDAHLGHVLRCIDDARADGGAVLTGGSRLARRGWFVPPTIIDRVLPDHRLFTTEVFGPVLAVTTCASTAEGVALANATPYGLVATGWSDDETESTTLADGLRAAWVTVNPHLAGAPNPRVGAESVGWSGSGVEGGLPAMRAATRLTVVQHGRPVTPPTTPAAPVASGSAPLD